MLVIGYFFCSYCLQRGRERCIWREGIPRSTSNVAYLVFGHPTSYYLRLSFKFLPKRRWQTKKLLQCCYLCFCFVLYYPQVFMFLRTIWIGMLSATGKALLILTYFLFVNNTSDFFKILILMCCVSPLNILFYTVLVTHESSGQNHLHTQMILILSNLISED